MKNLAASSVFILIICLVACNLDLGNSSSSDQDNDITTIDNSQTAQEAEDALCKGVNSIDGPGGFLWKPQSEVDGNLVVLFPEKFVDEFLGVLAELKGGELDAGVFTGFSNELRQTWRFSKPGSAYAGRLLVDAGIQECEWIVNDPEKVQD